MKKQIAGVSVSNETPPKREELVSLALKGRKYQNYNVPEATEAINKEIDKSGLYKSDSKGSDSKAKPDTGDNPGSGAKPRANNKKAGKGQVDKGSAA